jgi:hypothetical protein
MFSNRTRFILIGLVLGLCLGSLAAGVHTLVLRVAALEAHVERLDSDNAAIIQVLQRMAR